MRKAKPFDISKHLVAAAFEKIRANRGAAGVDERSIQEFEENLKGNLYKIWNRLASGSYFPPPVKAVAIPKKSGGQRVLGIPTVSERVAQMVVKMTLEPVLEPVFHGDSYGYRPGKSAHQAIDVTRRRCWRNDWVVEFDVRGLFDNIRHDLLMKAVRFHSDCKWVLLYVERWLVAPLQLESGELQARNRGTPQGGVVSPLLANLFMHYVFDLWMTKKFPALPFCRYADDGLVHCRSEKQAKLLLRELDRRFHDCGLELHPTKTKLVYCKDAHRRQEYENTTFDFLGYTFRPRRAVDRHGCLWLNFSPAISGTAAKAIRQTVRSWRIQLKSDKTIADLARMFRPYIQGWVNYYCRFYKTGFARTGEHLNTALIRWAMRKYARLRGHRRRTKQWLARIAAKQPNLFPHWKLGFRPVVG